MVYRVERNTCPPPAVAQTGKHQGMIIIALFEEFNCRSKEKNAGS